MPDSNDQWGDASTMYSKIALQVTLPPAKHLISMTNTLLPYDSPHASVLDNGCGTGILTQTLSKQYPSIPILAADLSAGMLEKVKELRLPNVRTKEVNGMDLGDLDKEAGNGEGGFSHVVSSFMHQFAPEPEHVVRECIRVLRPGGVLGLGSWSVLDVSDLWMQASQQIDPPYKAPNVFEGHWPVHEAETKRLMEEMGLVDVQVRSSRNSFAFGSVDEGLEYFFEAGNPAARKLIESWNGKVGIEAVRERMARMFREEEGRTVWYENVAEERGVWKLEDWGLEAILVTGKKAGKGT